MRLTFLKYSVFAIAFVLVGTGCHKDEAIDSSTPTIEIESISSNSVREGDPITFKIKYTDGDGDLGENNPDVNNLFLIDNRVNVTYAYRIQQLAPSSSSIIIRGSINVQLKSTAITNGGNSQDVTYSIYVVDRAGHQSNTVTTETITIHN